MIADLLLQEMLRQKRDFKTYTFTYLENLEILEKRFNIMNCNLIENEVLFMSQFEKNITSEYMKKI